MATIYKAQPDEIRGENHFTLPGDIELVLASEYDRIAAENEKLNATLEKLREVVPDDGDNYEDHTERTMVVWMGDIHDILYPKETPNDNG